MKSNDGSYDGWVEEVKAKTLKMIQEGRKKGVQAGEMDVS